MRSPLIEGGKVETNASAVTEEFRAQTKGTTLWKDDVLQLKTQLLWAWVRSSPFSRCKVGVADACHRAEILWAVG